MQRWLTYNSGGWCAHDLRRTFSTRLNAGPEDDGLGIAPHIVERMLNHKLGGVMAVYNQAPYYAERQQALDAWSTYLAGKAGAPADVISLRERTPQAA